MAFGCRARKQKGSRRHRAVIYSFVAVSELDQHQLVFLFHFFILSRQIHVNNLGRDGSVALCLASCHSHLPHRCSELVCTSVAALNYVRMERLQIVAVGGIVEEVLNCPEALAGVAVPADPAFGLRDVSASLETLAQDQENPLL